MRPILSLIKIVIFSLLSLTLIGSSQELLTNGDFESGRNSGWRTYAVASGVSTSADVVDLKYPRGGSWYAYVGDRTPDHASAMGVLRQDIDIPPNTTKLKLTFYISISTSDLPDKKYDTFGVYLRDFNDRILETFAERSNLDANDSGDPNDYTRIRKTIDASKYAGQRLILQFYAQTDEGLYTTFRVDDVSLEAEVIDTPESWAISVGAQEHGRVEPNGILMVNDGASLTINAKPDDGYKVKYWLLDGFSVSEGVEIFSLEDIHAPHAVSAVFELKSYQITLEAENGTITLEPSLNLYPHGTEIKATAVPRSGYAFAQWQVDGNGVRPYIYLKIKKPTTISARFILEEKPIDFRVANSTVPALIINPLPGYKYVIFRGDTPDSVHSPITVLKSVPNESILHSMLEANKATQYFRIDQIVDGSPKPFLRFPLRDTNINDAVVTSILDHHGNVSDRKDGVIRTCWGEVAVAETGTSYGYRGLNPILEPISSDPTSESFYQNFVLAAYSKTPSGGEFRLPFRYSVELGLKGEFLAFYDGHAGYDYSADETSVVVAAETGEFVIEECGGDNHSLVIDHKNGYRTRYLHLSKWDPGISNNDRTLDATSVEKGTVLGTAGMQGKAAGVHLHFSVHYVGSDLFPTDQAVLVDPYGVRASDNSVIYEHLWENWTPPERRQ